jgi:hypothetical protein
MIALVGSGSFYVNSPVTGNWEDFIAQNVVGYVDGYGEYDEYNWIPKGCVYFGEQLTAAGISVKVESYRDSHQSVLGERIRDYMLPYFSTILKFD